MSGRFGHDLDKNAFTLDLIEDLTFKRFAFEGDINKIEDVIKFMQDYQADKLEAILPEKKIDSTEFA
jgi:hypothetical protein